MDACVCFVLLIWAACHCRFCQSKPGNNSIRERKRTVNGFVVASFHFRKNLFNYSPWQWNHVLCNAHFCTVSPPSIHPSISLSFAFCLPVPLLFRILMYALLSKLLRMSWLFIFCNVRMKPKKSEIEGQKKIMLETNVYKQTKHPHKWLACWQKQPFSTLNERTKGHSYSASTQSVSPLQSKAEYMYTQMC